MAYVIRNRERAYIYETSVKTVRATTKSSQAKIFAAKEDAESFMKTIPSGYKNYYIECCAVPDKKTKRCSISPMVRRYIYRRDNGKCALCGCDISYSDFTVDHIIPLSKGGENDIDNFQCTCGACNMFKQNILMEDFIQKISDILLFRAKKKIKNKFKRNLFHKAMKMIL